MSQGSGSAVVSQGSGSVFSVIVRHCSGSVCGAVVSQGGGSVLHL